MCLAAHFMRVDHNGHQVQGGHRAGHVEGRGAGFETHGRPGWEGVVSTQARQSLRRRGHRTASYEGPLLVLDHEHRLPAVYVKADVVGSHWAVLPALDVWGSLRMTPWYTADLTAAQGGRLSSSSIRFRGDLRLASSRTFF